MIYRLDHQSDHAADDENPEQVEEIQRDIALAAHVAADHALGERRLVFVALIHAPERALQPPFLQQSRVKGYGERDQYGHLDGRHEQIRAQPVQCERQQSLGERHHHDDIRPPGGIPPSVADQQHAQHGQACRVGTGDHRLGACEDECQVQHVDGHTAVENLMHRISRHQHDDGESDDALQQHEHAVDAGDQRQPPVRGILAGVAFRFLFDVGEYRLVGECVDVRGELLPVATLTGRIRGHVSALRRAFAGVRGVDGTQQLPIACHVHAEGHAERDQPHHVSGEQ